MSATFYIHVSPAKSGIVWWAETPDVVGLSLAADSLAELRALIGQAVELHLGRDRQIALVLVADDQPATESAESPAWLGDLPAVEAPSIGPEARRSLLRVA